MVTAEDHEEFGEGTLDEVLLYSLSFIIIDGNEYFFLADIQSITGFHENEALLALYN